MLKGIVEKAKSLMNLVGPVDERRSIVRLDCSVPVQVICDQATHIATVSDLSLKGLRLQISLQLDAGERILVSLPKSGNGPVTCRVVWSKSMPTGGFSCGARFDDTKESLANSWLSQTLRQLGFQLGNAKERRNFIRFPAPPAAVTLVDGNGDVLTEGKLMNVGYGGALVAAIGELTDGTGVRLILEATSETPALDTLVVVRSSVKDKKRKFYVTGLQFGKPGSKDVKTYIRALKKRLG